MTLEILTLVMIIVGTSIIGVTFFKIKSENSKNIANQMNINEAGFEEYHTELNETALGIYKELDDKYREILVIYDLIEKKHNDIRNTENSINISANNSDNSKFAKKFDSTVDASVKGSSNHQFAEAKVEMDKLAINQNRNIYDSSKGIQNNLEVFKSSKSVNHEQVVDNEDNLAMKLLDEQLKDEELNNKQSKHSDVVELLNKGFSVSQIARELNISTGEVMLVKELQKVKNEQI